MQKDIKERKSQVNARIPEIVRGAPKELVRHGALLAKEKAIEQVTQTAQNGQAMQEDSSPSAQAGSQIESTGRELTSNIASRVRQAARVGERNLAYKTKEKRVLPREREEVGTKGESLQNDWPRQGETAHPRSGKKQNSQYNNSRGMQPWSKGEGRNRRGVTNTGKPGPKTLPGSLKTAQDLQATAQQATKAAQQAARKGKRFSQATVRTAKTAGRALANTAKACIVALKSLTAALVAAGGVTLVIVLLICLIALVAGSAFGIFFSVEPTGKGMTLKEATRLLNAEYYGEIAEIQDKEPHDRMEFEAQDGAVAICWEDVLAVFAAGMAADERGQQVVALGEEQLRKLRAVLWDMNQISYHTYTESHEEEVTVTGEDGKEFTEIKTVTETVLVIEVEHKTAQEMTEVYGFTARQNEQLALLAAPQYDALWMELLGGFAGGGGEIVTPESDWVGTGIWTWPLPHSFTITSRFGYREDPITGELDYHSGTDIAAPAGTPILAGASGTVIVANGTDPWGGGYGYYVRLDHGGGLETLYGHCATITVTAGKEVQQGEVIGYVGSTGNSTGNHLHFEVRQNTEAVDAMMYFSK